MKLTLTVVENFLDHVKGEVITDAKLVKQYLDSEWQAHFVKTAPLPADPAPK